MRRPRLRLLLIAVTALTAAVVLVRFAGRLRVDDLVRVETLADEALPELLQRIRDFHRVVTRNGEKVLEISASEASYFRDTSAVEIVTTRTIASRKMPLISIDIPGETTCD